MGTFRVSIEVGDPAGQRYETIEALVDTGATYTTVPAPVLARLGVIPSRAAACQPADVTNGNFRRGDAGVGL